MAAATLLTQAAALWALSDKNKNCPHWADTGECESNPNFMRENCAASCGKNSDSDGAECLRRVGSVPLSNCGRNTLQHFGSLLRKQLRDRRVCPRR